MERTCDQICYLPRFYWGCCHHRNMTLSQPGWGKWYKINWLTTFTVNTANHSQSQPRRGLWLVQSDLLGSCSLMDFHAWRQGKGRGQGTRNLSQAKFQQNIFMAALRLSYWLSCLAQLVSASWRESTQSLHNTNSECYVVVPRLCCFLDTWNNWPNVMEVHDSCSSWPSQFGTS